MTWLIETSRELRYENIGKFEKPKLRSSFADNIWGADIADVKLITKFNRKICFLLFVIGLYSKNAWIIFLKGNKCTTITMEIKIQKYHQ